MNGHDEPLPEIPAPPPLPGRRRFSLYREGSPAILLVGVILFFSFAPGWREASLALDWPRAEAKVTGAETVPPSDPWNRFWSRRATAAGASSAESLVTVRLRYEFKDPSGALRTGEGPIGMWRAPEAERIARAMREGGVKTIRYDPADPSRSSPSFEKPAWPMLLSLAGAFLTLLGGLLFLAVAFAQKPAHDGVPDWARR